jgi:serine carboxypeptidase-like clade 1
MNYSTVKPWSSWLDADGQVGGYSTHYANNFSFVTIKGAGHMAAQIKPSQMWTVMSTFFSGGVV